MIGCGGITATTSSNRSVVVTAKAEFAEPLSDAQWLTPTVSRPSGRYGLVTRLFLVPATDPGRLQIAAEALVHRHRHRVPHGRRPMRILVTPPTCATRSAPGVFGARDERRVGDAVKLVQSHCISIWGCDATTQASRAAPSCGKFGKPRAAAVHCARAGRSSAATASTSSRRAWSLPSFGDRIDPSSAASLIDAVCGTESCVGG